MILYFISPKTIITAASKFGGKAGEFLPIVGPTVTCAKKAQKYTKITDPVSATARGIGTMFNYCFGKGGAITIECALWLGLSVVGGVTGNPYLIAAGAEVGNVLIEEVFE